MSQAIDPITALQSLPAASGIAAPAAAGADFSAWMSEQLAALNQTALDAADQVESLALGDMDNLHHVMIELEKARLTFDLAVQIRNKVLEGYQEILRMQI